MNPIHNCTLGVGLHFLEIVRDIDTVIAVPSRLCTRLTKL